MGPRRPGESCTSAGARAGACAPPAWLRWDHTERRLWPLSEPAGIDLNLLGRYFGGSLAQSCRLSNKSAAWAASIAWCHGPAH
jgi:hypothetical protein